MSVCLSEPNIEIVGVHLGLTPGVRRRQMDELKKVLNGRDHPVMLAGDFNEWNTRRLLFDAPNLVVLPGPSFHAARPSVSLDCFVLGDGLRAISAHVHSSPLASRASDHLPIVIDLEFTDSHK